MSYAPKSVDPKPRLLAEDAEYTEVQGKDFGLKGLKRPKDGSQDNNEGLVSAKSLTDQAIEDTKLDDLNSKDENLVTDLEHTADKKVEDENGDDILEDDILEDEVETKEPVKESLGGTKLEPRRPSTPQKPTSNDNESERENGDTNSESVDLGTAQKEIPKHGNNENSGEEDKQVNRKDLNKNLHDLKSLKNLEDLGFLEDLMKEDDLGDEEDPPVLKYSRLNQLPLSLFKSDPVSTVTFNDSVFIFGTHSGYIHLCNPDISPIRTFKAHRASVLSLFTDGLYFASGSMDGTIIIGSVSDPQDIVLFDYKRPIHAVVLEHNYQRTRSFVCGGMSGKVIFSSKNWLDQRVEAVLDEGHGPIVSIQTIGNLIFWMNDLGITVYHISTRQTIATIDKPSDAFRSDLYWPRVSFPETDRVLVAWGNYIWSLRVAVKGSGGGNIGAGSSVKSRLLPSAATISFRAAPQIITIEHTYKVDYIVSGIAAFDGDQWLVLAYNPPMETSQGKLESQNPDLKLIRAIDGTTLYEEEIGFDCMESLGLNDYSLGNHIGSETRYFIISARGGVIAQQIQLDDSLLWYLQRHLYRKAWSMSKHLVKPTERLNYGLLHLYQLVEGNQWESAALWMAELLYLDESQFPLVDTKSTLTSASAVLQPDEKEMYVKEVGSSWNKWCELFIDSGHEKELTGVIPNDPRWSLKKSHYSRVLIYWLSNPDPSNTANELLLKWNPEIYEVDMVTSTMEQLLETEPGNVRLRRTLCDVYEKCLDPAKAVPHMRILREPTIVQFLDKYHLLQTFISSVPQFIRLGFQKDSDIETLPVTQVRSTLKEVTAIFVQKRFEVMPETVVQLMASNHLEIVNYLYLEELAAIDDLLVYNLADTRIELYCQFDRPKLLPFLTTNQHYNVITAIEICERSDFVDELVYLLGKTGQTIEALNLIMHELDDPERAIKFAKVHTDSETWSSLLEYSFSRPKYIKALIELSDDQSSCFYNPITILQNMSTDINVEGLKKSVTRVSLDNDLNVIVNQLVLRIVCSRSEELSKQWHHQMVRGFLFAADNEQVRKIANLFETLVITLTGSNSAPAIGLVSDVVQGYNIAYQLSNDLATKSPHLEAFSETQSKESS